MEGFQPGENETTAVTCVTHITYLWQRHAPAPERNTDTSCHPKSPQERECWNSEIGHRAEQNRAEQILFYTSPFRIVFLLWLDTCESSDSHPSHLFLLLPSFPCTQPGMCAGTVHYDEGKVRVLYDGKEGPLVMMMYDGVYIVQCSVQCTFL